MIHEIVWRGLYMPGHEYCRLQIDADVVSLSGAAIFLHEKHGCYLNYEVVCDVLWKTQSARVKGQLGPKLIDVEIEAQSGVWTLNGVVQPQVSGCTDVDLNFSPSTNVLPIRRLNLSVGDDAPVNVAWLHFPSFELRLLTQTYRRIGGNEYRYESGGGSFVADLQVNEVGLVTLYPELWEQEMPPAE
jgi:uncharacterized protein